MSVKLFSRLIFLLLSVSSFSFSMMQSLELSLLRDTNDEATDVCEYTQELEFHKRLKRGAYKEWLQDGVQAYYKRITPITSSPDSIGTDRWDVFTVSIADKNVNRNASGWYMYEGISFKINLPVNFDSTQILDVLVTHNKECKNVQFAKCGEIKVPALPRLNCYADILNAVHCNRLCLIHKVTLKGVLWVPGEMPCIILIEIKNKRRQPCTVQGMQVVFNKDDETTRIFLDYANAASESVAPIKCKHSSITCDKKVLCIKEHEVYECDGKKIYGFFESPEIRKKWIPDETNFYDQNCHALTSLPSCYRDPDDWQETLKQPIVWILGEVPNLFYQLDSVEELQDTNDYIYSTGNSFFVTLPYKGTFKECLSNNNTIQLDYLVQVAVPHCLIGDVVEVEAGDCDWPTGIYKRICSGDESLWQSVGTSEVDLINFLTKKDGLRTIWPTEELDAKQNKQWRDAAQRFFLTFPAKIYTCDRAILNGLKTWDKLTDLDLSCMKLANGVQWKDVLAAVSSMTQLTTFCFACNNPRRICAGSRNYTEVANIITDCYLALARCLRKLTRLKKLHIHGLWLRSSKYLGSGISSDNNPSWQAAELTGLINHNDQVGVQVIINSICDLQHLKSLSMDGIPNHGSSRQSRINKETILVKVLVLPLELLLIPVFIIEGDQQDKDLKKLVSTSADQLAKIPSLKKIDVYSPGENCIDYFSLAFRRTLVSRRAAIPTLAALIVKAKELK